MAEGEAEGSGRGLTPEELTLEKERLEVERQKVKVAQERLEVDKKIQEQMHDQNERRMNIEQENSDRQAAEDAKTPEEIARAEHEIAVLREDLKEMQARGLDTTEQLQKIRNREAKIDKVKKIAAGVGKVGAGALGAAAATGKGLGRVAKAATKPLRNKSNSPKRSRTKWERSNSGEGNFVYWWYFFITLLIHILVVWKYDEIEKGGLGVLWYMIIFIFITGMFAFLRRHEPEEVRQALICTFVALIVYILPRLIQEWPVNGEIQTAIFFLMVYVPVWPVFLATKLESTSNSRLFHWLFLLWKLGLVLITLVLAANLLMDQGPVFASLDIGSPVDVWQGAKDFTSNTAEKWWALFKGTTAIYDRATDPGSYYAGQVEENDRVPLGVEIENLRPNDPRVGNETPFVVYGTVRARPIESDLFVGAEVLVRPSCVIDKKDAPEPAVDPPEMSIVWGTFGQFQCAFPPLGRKGTYSIIGSATFPFETWAYIPYTFVKDETARNLAGQGKDIRRELNIKENALATYTSGPVLLGMGGTPQPLVVKADGLQEGTKLGITLDSNWHGGKILSVEKLELRVPEGFTLDGCDRDPVHEQGEEDTKADNMLVWTFENPKIDPVTLYSSVTCDLILDATKAATLVPDDKMIQTFVGSAYYTYILDEKTSVQVR